MKVLKLSCLVLPLILLTSGCEKNKNINNIDWYSLIVLIGLLFLFIIFALGYFWGIIWFLDYSIREIINAVGKSLILKAICSKCWKKTLEQISEADIERRWEYKRDNYDNTYTYEQQIGIYSVREFLCKLCGRKVTLEEWKSGDKKPRDIYYHHSTTLASLILIVFIGAFVYKYYCAPAMDRSRLHVAIMNAQAVEVERLISGGADVNAKSKSGTTPLHIAASKGHIDVMKLLISKGANVNARDKYGVTPLHEVAGQIFFGENLTLANMAVLLIENGADINAKCSWLLQKEVTPLHLAAENGHLALLELLISNGADVNAKDSRGETPLHYANHQPNADVARILREHGAKE